MQRSEECEAYLEEAAINTCDPKPLLMNWTQKEIQDPYKNVRFMHKKHINHTHDMCIKPAQNDKLALRFDEC